MSDQPYVQKSYIPVIDPAGTAAAAQDTAAPPKSIATHALKWLNRAVATSLVLFMGVFAWSAVQSRLPAKGQRPKSGIDWLLWASGSDETFATAMQKKIDASSHEFDDILKRQQQANPDMMKFMGGQIKFDNPPVFDARKMFYQPTQSPSSKLR